MCYEMSSYRSKSKGRPTRCESQRDLFQVLLFFFFLFNFNIFLIFTWILLKFKGICNFLDSIQSMQKHLDINFRSRVIALRRFFSSFGSRKKAPKVLKLENQIKWIYILEALLLCTSVLAFWLFWILRVRVGVENRHSKSAHFWGEFLDIAHRSWIFC